MHAEPPLDQVMRQLRIVHFIFLTTTIIFVVIGELLRVELPDALPPILPMAFAVVGVGDLAIGSVLRKKGLDAAREKLQRRPDDPQGAQEWRAGHLLGFASAETTVLFGLVLRLLTGTLAYAAPFYAVGTAMLLVWAPRHPE